MNDAPSLKARLVSQLEGVCSYLLPAGKVIKNEFRVGSLSGEAGNSLAVQLAGERRGLWQDFAHPGDAAQSGDVFALWMGAHGCTFKDACGEIERYLGITRIEAPKAKPLPPPPDESACGPMRGTEAIKYLHDRGLNDETLKLYRVRAHSRNSEFNQHFIAFRFTNPDGQPVMLKSTGIAKKPPAEGKTEGAKDIWTTKPYYTLFGWWLVGPNVRSIIITEGEIDAMSVHQLSPGLPVLSMPSGASNLDWIENDWEALQRFEKIYILTDMDEAGERAALAIAKRLGQARCVRIPVPAPFKDANEALQKADPEALEWSSTWLAKAYSYDPKTLVGPAGMKDAVKALLKRDRAEAEHNTFLFPGVPFRLRSGEMTLFTGYPHGGKSTGAYQIHLSEMENGERVLLASYEIPPEKMLVELATMKCRHAPTDEELDACLDWLTGKLWFYRPPQENATLDALLGDMRYATERFGVTRHVVDSLHFLAAKEDYEGQDKVSASLYKFAVNTATHVALVAHSAKSKDADRVPGMGDVEGSGGVCKPVDNGITFWRNSNKDEKIEKARESGDSDAIKKAEALPDGIMQIWKQRTNGKLSRTKLWFCTEAKRFRTTPEPEPKMEPATTEKAEDGKELF